MSTRFSPKRCFESINKSNISWLILLKDLWGQKPLGAHNVAPAPPTVNLLVGQDGQDNQNSLKKVADNQDQLHVPPPPQENQARQEREVPLLVQNGSNNVHQANRPVVDLKPAPVHFTHGHRSTATVSAICFVFYSCFYAFWSWPSANCYCFYPIYFTLCSYFYVLSSWPSAYCSCSCTFSFCFFFCFYMFYLYFCMIYSYFCFCSLAY